MDDNEILLISIRKQELAAMIEGAVNKAIHIRQQQDTTNTDTADGAMSAKEAAKYLGISIATLYSKNSRGELPSYKAPGGKSLVFFKDELTAFIKTGRKPTKKEIQEHALDYLKPIKQKRG